MEIKQYVQNKDIDKLISLKGKIFSKLQSLNSEERKIAWEALNLIANSGSFEPSIKEKRYLRSLLWHSLRGVRDDAWKNLELYKKFGIEGVERTLTANSDKLKFSAWSNVIEMINLGFVSKEYVISVRNSFWRLLKSRIGTIRRKSWRLFIKLVSEGIFSLEDKERFKEFLRHRKINVRLYAWSAAMKLAELGFISIEELEKEIEQILWISKLKKRVGYKARDILEKLKHM
ncbi:MAG: hypothetical protein RQ952_07925 [Thermoproteota archaeon]|jgi:hypothetical protein|nr:hypothetical protein [Thermoproteota archaeon]